MHSLKRYGQKGFCNLARINLFKKKIYEQKENESRRLIGTKIIKTRFLESYHAKRQSLVMALQNKGHSLSKIHSLNREEKGLRLAIYPVTCFHVVKYRLRFKVFVYLLLCYFFLEKCNKVTFHFLNGNKFNFY